MVRTDLLTAARQFSASSNMTDVHNFLLNIRFLSAFSRFCETRANRERIQLFIILVILCEFLTTEMKDVDQFRFVRRCSLYEDHIRVILSGQSYRIYWKFVEGNARGFLRAITSKRWCHRGHLRYIRMICVHGKRVASSHTQTSNATVDKLRTVFLLTVATGCNRYTFASGTGFVTVDTLQAPELNTPAL